MTMVKTTLVTRTETVNVVAATIYIDFAPRCVYCRRILATQATRPWIIQCSRRECKKQNFGNTETQ